MMYGYLIHQHFIPVLSTAAFTLRALLHERWDLSTPKTLGKMDIDRRELGVRALILRVWDRVQPGRRLPLTWGDL